MLPTHPLGKPSQGPRSTYRQAASHRPSSWNVFVFLGTRVCLTLLTYITVQTPESSNPTKLRKLRDSDAVSTVPTTDLNTEKRPGTAYVSAVRAGRIGL